MFAEMKMASGVREGRFGERLNRFLARVEVDGKETLAHVPNSGRMRELFVPGATVYVSPAVTPGRKTAFDLLPGLNRRRSGVVRLAFAAIVSGRGAEIGKACGVRGASGDRKGADLWGKPARPLLLGAEGAGVRGNEVGDAGLGRKSAVPGCSDYARDKARSDADEGSGRRARGGGGIRGAEG